MNFKQISYIFSALILIFAWNLFAIERDKKLITSYNQLTEEQKSCSKQLKWHPDCKVK